MSFAKTIFIASAVLLAAACGGAAFSRDGDGDGGSASSAGSSSQAGKPATGGTSSGGGSNPTGGRSGTGGTVSVAGSVGVAGGPNCAAVDCAYPVCSDGAKPVIKPGECCPTCPASTNGCEGVVCLPVSECNEGYELMQPVGACCKGCVPKGGQVACAKVACVPEKTCLAGYVRGDLVGGCCYECLPDPLYCSDVSDCVTADRPRSCCGCPEAINRRSYDADECWSDVNAPRMIPQGCYPEVICDALCGECAPPAPLMCAGHRCTLGLPQ